MGMEETGLAVGHRLGESQDATGEITRVESERGDYLVLSVMRISRSRSISSIRKGKFGGWKLRPGAGTG